MKLLLFILAFLTSPFLYSQKYSSVINDKEIIEFMNWLLTKDSIKTNINLDNKLIPNKNLVYGTLDTAKYPMFETWNIFNKRNRLDSFLNQNDGDFFIKQVEGQKLMRWDHQFPNYTLITYPKNTKDKKYNMRILDSLNRLYNTVWAYSLPIFSVDKQKVIIIERFYCGIVCGGGSFNLYERKGEIWKKLREFNYWSN